MDRDSTVRPHKGETKMTTIKRLKKHYALGIITEGEYKKKEEWYIRILLDMYCDGMISKDELYRRVKG